MASTYLSATLGTATNRKKWTYSAWVKKSRPQASVDEQIFGSYADATTSYYSRIADNGSSKFEFTEYNGSGYSINLRPSNKQRDVNGWYHIVVGYDSTQATASNRVKFYINGEQVTTWTQESYPSQNYESGINKNQLHTIGKETSNSSYYFDGSMSHVHFIDGTQYAASDFGETDSTTGEWKIKTSPNVTYGNNGFFILKNGNSVTDQSGEGNNWAVGGGTLTKTEDNPSNVFATGNALIGNHSNGNALVPNYSNGNTTSSYGSGEWRIHQSTLGASSGKYYCEYKWVSNSNTAYAYVGIYDLDGYAQKVTGYPYMADMANCFSIKDGNGQVWTGSSGTSYGTSYTVGDIIGVAMDLDNNKCYWSKNGTWMNSANPSSGTGGYSITANKTYAFGVQQYSQGGSTWSANYGNGYFGTTAISSEGTNASGIGKFEYDVPTGYTALSTKGLNE